MFWGPGSRCALFAGGSQGGCLRTDAHRGKVCEMQSRKEPLRVDPAMQEQVSEWTVGLSGQHLAVPWGSEASG